ncbi:unnamed protein product [Parascedosporium putredinis]|uniref:tRNA-binding domain-containing protein n=1 Tax=Parascedosporium putredinis TaxID=1442378 RepID=A0A9P1GUX5_9PEZI|nr:unnamed protein product [Parascedosporium putredinis]CAI7987842.1 unnamed protein product [Parascedosporium putredinis]
MAAISSQTYTPEEETEIKQWLTTSDRLKSGTDDKRSILDSLDAHLSSRTTLLGTKPSKADVALYETLAPVVAQWSPDERTGKGGHPNIVRLVDFVQNSSLFGLDVKAENKIKAEKERLKKEKAAAAGGNEAELVDRTKKEGAAAAKEGDEGKAAKAPAAPAVLSPCLIDLRVGHILKAVKHPEADSLYVSTIAMGDPAGTADTEEFEGQVCRTVCSGLNGLVPLEDMQQRKVVVVCNLKPVKMRGIKSVRLSWSTPADAKAGERVFFEGWQGEPEGVLNPKKKVWETFQPGFTTTDGLEVAFNASTVEALGKKDVGKLVTVGGGVCTVPTLKDAQVR